MYSGHDVEHLLDTYSLEQLGAHASWIIKYQAEMLNLLLGPIAAMQGHEWKPAKTGEEQRGASRPRDPSHHKNADYTDPAAKERALELALARRFRVRTKAAVPDGAGDGGGSTS